MSKFYYLISSLPSIYLWDELEVDMDTFLLNCEEWLTVNEMEILKETDVQPKKSPNHSITTTERWYNWETCLRNRLVRHRSTKLDLDQTLYLREEYDYFSEVDRVVQEALSAETPLQKEKVLDEQRWVFLNSLEACHIFDLDLLCIYKLKLQLCEKWLHRTTDRGKNNFEKALNELYKGDILEIV
ncbi:MAG: DUF2764 domain-containing protein [Victivallales bacterium]|nr:DUF2764 domain-containing protein [Victivallales bacterium]MCF7888831.1 DUF2764 domain-containing protein [Victivallales bacterium]